MRAANISSHTKQLHKEIDLIPEEYRGLLLRIVHSFREGVALPSAEDSLREGWQDVLQGNTQGVDSLWDEIDTK